MLTLHCTEEETNDVSDNLFKVIKECPFERNKDVSNWADAKHLYDACLKNTFGSNGAGAAIVGKTISIEEPDTARSIDMNSYLVVDLMVELHHETARLVRKFPISY